MPASNIDFTTVTHVIHFSLIPNSDGSLNSSANSLSVAFSSDLITRAHAAGQKALICIGGASTESGFQSAASAANRANFVANLVNFMTARGYDGIDVDWEALPVSDFNLFTNLVVDLRGALDKLSPHKLLTVAAGAYPVYGDPPNSSSAMYASLQSQFDQINIMTYDLSGPYDGWITWFNSPIYDGGTRFVSSGGLVPSIDGAVNNFLANGVAAAKLGIGVPFYGYIWSGGSGGTVPSGGVTRPRQSWTTAPSFTSVNYNTIVSSYFQSNSYFWDTNGQAAYLSITNGGNKFISYDDPYACQAKVSYARNRGLGGVMVWELALDYFPARPAGLRSPLLQSLKQSLATPGVTAVVHQGTNIMLSFPSSPLALYRVQWTSNLNTCTWNTLTNNVAGNGQVLQIIDTNSFTRPGRYYRVRTPP